MNEFYMQRHFKLWEDKNTRLNRVVFLTVILSLALVIKVLIPFVDFSDDKKPIIQEIESLKVEKETTNKKIETINETTKVLQSVNKFISQQPWQNEKKALIKRYKDMRRSPPAEGYSREYYQQVANNTITNIADQLSANILTPLQRSVVEIDDTDTSPDGLTEEVDSLDQFINDWKKKYTNKNWYRTIGMKDNTMSRLTRSLNRRLDDFSDVIKKELITVNQAKLAVDSELDILNEKFVEEEDKLQALDNELQKILPEWLRGFIDVEQVIQLLPAALILAAAFALSLGVSLTKHYNIYVSDKKFAAEIRNDSGMSTVWTMIPRGLLGSIQTIAAYTLFIIFTWLLFEKSMVLLLEWLSIDSSSAWISNNEFWETFLWLSRLSFILLLTYILTRIRPVIFKTD